VAFRPIITASLPFSLRDVAQGERIDQGRRLISGQSGQNEKGLFFFSLTT
jgi:hypothetical protein